MFVTNIMLSPGSKSRYRIYIDEEFAFVLYKGELRQYDISIDNELSSDSYKDIIEKLLPKRAKKRALYLLKSRRYTDKQMRDKLMKNEYSLEIIDETLDYLKSYQYIDDIQYTKDYIECYMDTKSRNRILLDLLKKGINNDLTTVIYFQMVGDDYAAALEKEQIKKLLEKKRYEKDTADLKEKQRIYAFLFRKGFSAASIKCFI